MKEEKGLKKEEETSTGTDQPEEKNVEEKSEDIETLKARLQKSEEERENLSKAVTRLNKERKLPSESEEEEEYPEWDESSKKFQEQTISKVEKKTQEILEKANEKEAINKFTATNPDVDWNYIVSNYSPTHGKSTVGDIVKDLERAMVLAKYETGELTDLENKAFKKGETEGKAQSAAANMASVGKATSKTSNKGESSLSKGAIKLAESMRVDIKKLAEEDDSPTAVIKP